MGPTHGFLVIFEVYEGGAGDTDVDLRELRASARTRRTRR